jgi:hypothetical protein
MNEQLAQEAWNLHHRLSLACLAEEGKRDSAGHKTGDQQRIKHMDRLIPLAADRWRRRMGYEWRRVPAGVRGSR